MLNHSRRALAVLLTAFLASAGLVLFTQAPASACTCAQQPLAKQLSKADLVVTGEVVSEGASRITVDLDRVYSGTVTTPELTVRNPSACSLEGVAVGETWLLLVKEGKSADQVSACSGSRVLTEQVLSRVEGRLGPGTAAPRPEPPKATMTDMEVADPTSFTRLAAPGGALVLVGLLGLAVVRRVGRRSR